MEAVLSDGTILDIPDGTPDDKVLQQMQWAETQLTKPADDGVNPVPVDPNVDQPGWDWLRNTYPNVFNAGHEFVTGVAEGVGDLPNAIPNTVNAANEIYHLHADEPGTPPPQPLMDQWMTGSGFADKSIEEMNPQTPGWEGTRDYGRKTGTGLVLAPLAAAGALPAAALVGSAVAAPALAKSGGYAGRGIDYLTSRPNDPNSNVNTHKWERTIEATLPLASGLMRTGSGLLSRSGTELPKPGFGTYAVTSAIDPRLPFYIKGATTAAKAARLATPGTGGALSDILSTAVNTAVPLAQDSKRWAR